MIYENQAPRRDTGLGQAQRRHRLNCRTIDIRGQAGAAKLKGGVEDIGGDSPASEARQGR